MATAAALKPSIPKQLLPPNSDFWARRFQEETTMTWTIPGIVEMVVGLEINGYACAELN